MSPTATSEIAPPDGPSQVPSSLESIVRLGVVLLALYVFLCSINGMGAAFKAFGEGAAEAIMQAVSNPIIGLMVGILVTSLVQSSSTTTSMVVGMVGGGILDVPSAVPIVMGANIGTTITNTIVSLGMLGRGEVFRRTFSAAIVHDTFNLLAVALLLPAELLFGLVSRPASFLAHHFHDASLEATHSPIKAHFKSVIGWSKGGLRSLFGEEGGKYALLVLSLLLMIACLMLIVRNMKGLVLRRVELFFDRFLGRSAILAMGFGTVLTIAVQSSSITTSLLVPLAGAGVISLEALFPITLGCNVGTTVTALIASTSTELIDGLTIALCHLLFNVFGIVLIYGLKPIRRLTLGLTRGIANLATRRRWMAFAYVATVFFVIPGIILGLQELLGK